MHNIACRSYLCMYRIIDMSNEEDNISIGDMLNKRQYEVLKNILSIDMSNEDIRINLIRYLKMFRDMQCHYSYEEQVAVRNALEVISEPKKENEDYNKKHPVHGEQY